MSRIVATSGALPFSYGLGVEPSPLPANTPWWGALIHAVGKPLAEGTAARIAYGKQQPYYGYPGGSLFSSSPYGTGYDGAFGGLQPSTLLLLGGAALLLVVMMGRK